MVKMVKTYTKLILLVCYVLNYFQSEKTFRLSDFTFLQQKQMTSLQQHCIYCRAFADETNYVECNGEEHECCHECDGCSGQTFMWSLDEFIVHTYGIDYMMSLRERIEAYLRSLINNCPLPDTYLDEDRILGCHIEKYIDEFTHSLRYDFTSIIVNNNLADDTVRAIVKHYATINLQYYGRPNGLVFDIEIECIQKGNIPYIDHYYKYIEPHSNNRDLDRVLYSIIRFITANLEFNTADNIAKLREIYGKENFDKEMTRMLSNLLRQNDIIRLNTLPPSLQTLDCSFKKIHSLETTTLLTLLTPSYNPIKFDKTDLDRVQAKSSEFKIFKAYYHNYIGDEHTLNSLLIDNKHIRAICDENSGILTDIKNAIMH